jgi:hypothetical protein
MEREMDDSKLADDLKAARALIDTPEKMEAMRPEPLFEAMHQACDTERQFWDGREALLNVSGARSLQATKGWAHSDVMSLFDRAIAAALPKPEAHT